MKNNLKLYRAFLIVVIFSCTKNIHGQNTTSPYSILGIGDIETKDFGRWYGMGSTSTALGSPYYINASNPASLMSLNERMMNFDLANRGKSTKFRYPTADTLTATTKDFSIRRISLAFKPNKRSAFSFGLKPYSTINYLLQENNTDYANTLVKVVDGSGGLNQLYFSYAHSLAKNLNIGITSSYLFGSANINTLYYGQELAATLDKQEYNIMNAFQFQAGLQYTLKASDFVTHKFGFTISNPSTVHQHTETEYLNNNVSIKKTTEQKNNFQLPLSVAFGYGIILNDNLTISADAVYNNWQQQNAGYINSYTTPSGRISAGIEYASRKKIGSYWVENWYLQGGANAEKNYFTVEGKPLNSYGITAGFGKNLSGLISVYGGYEYGIRGNNSYNQIKEQYNQYIIGFTLKEYWFNFRKYGKYQ